MFWDIGTNKAEHFSCTFSQNKIHKRANSAANPVSGLGPPSLAPINPRVLFPSASLCSVQQETFLKERIKVNGKTGNLGNIVQVGRMKNKINVTSEKQFSKR